MADNECSRCEVYLTDLGIAHEQYKTAENEPLCQACYEEEE